MQKVTTIATREPHHRIAVRAPSRRAALGAVVLALLPALSRRGASAVAAAPVRIVFDVNANPPLFYGSGTAIDPVKPGLVVEMLRMAGERANIAVEFSRTPWQRGLYLIEAGQADAIFASSFVEERLRFGVYPLKNGLPDTRRKLFDQSYRFYIRAGSGVDWDGKTLTHLRAPVGATTGFSIVKDLRAMGLAVEEEPSHIGNLRKLAAGRIDAYAELDTHIRPLLRGDPAEFGTILELSPPVRTKPYYLMFSKIFYVRAPDIAERIWDAIAVVNESSPYQDVLHSSRYAD
ncbi:MAG: polar amino acid transport system substrate-binding protein [Acetobacteraceae bacterium]|jgi:polar amino acid transport system substrate-binding protein|nr:polar amino acid transport system substrate-binding protein [Acetobacteraceae bacterium]